MKASKRFERRVARRAFVRSGVVGALAIPAWIHVAFGKNACPPGKQKPAGMFIRDLRWDQLVAGAFARAASAGKPLLVLVAKQHDWRRAHAFGELLNYGSDEALALLGLCEVVCAPVAAVNRLVPRRPQPDDEPLMVLIETNALPARFTSLDTALPEPKDVLFERNDENRPWSEVYKRREQQEDEQVSQRIRLLTDLLSKNLAPSQRAILSPAEDARSKLGAHQGANTVLKAQSITAADVKNSPPLADVVLMAAAPLLAQAYAANGSDRSRLTNLVAEATRVALCQHRIPGSRWAQSAGCGITIEWLPGEIDNRAFAIGCGMGHVPKRSRRILDFLTFDKQGAGGAW